MPPQFAAIFLVLLTPIGLQAATPSKQEQEYQQVRTIALRDPKVRAAYAEADKKLAAKILQIDPALESYLQQRNASNPASSPAKPVAKSTATTPAPYRRSHVVVKGDTLGSIAVKYGVDLSVLKSVNHITDDRKLAVGQVLAVPNEKARR